jgi:acid stress chaperone HdeB
MRNLFFAAIFLSQCVFAPAALAERVNLRELTCDMLLDLGADDADAAAVIMVWLDGYLSGVTGDTTFDDKAMGQFAEALGKACERSRNSKVIEVAKIVGIR